ncbi:hypothetical protein QE193_21995 (plasmid) [Arsenophonus nasoniae]|uniref:Uncharacterized protein n=1 Tax=Arsenophonus nasoniae TaxID=638 RepID=D2U0T6_9GAMM|nr:hypothetical protein [Arsenophonus nasoniae]QBY46569.1 hypothetical protein ArsFIN_51800 [Arsenophonus nasoniae]WGM08417.1 hypothetical protein QE258_23595 [Arsenophonus nasoniae]WGM17931.1 hypothetical protein QE193_21995 [Arsenophonus nasoniae]CBA74095.1 conserved hypothetical protein [Arsenophonus nasoniae]
MKVLKMYFSLFVFSYGAFWSIPTARVISRQIFYIALILYCVGTIFHVPIFEFMAKSTTLVLAFVPPICCYSYFMLPIKREIPNIIRASTHEDARNFSLTLENNGKIRTLNLIHVKPVILTFFIKYIEYIVDYAKHRNLIIKGKD